MGGSRRVGNATVHPGNGATGIWAADPIAAEVIAVGPVAAVVIAAAPIAADQEKAVGVGGRI